jgi:hypothetical protein
MTGKASKAQLVPGELVQASREKGRRPGLLLEALDEELAWLIGEGWIKAYRFENVRFEVARPDLLLVAEQQGAHVPLGPFHSAELPAVLDVTATVDDEGPAFRRVDQETVPRQGEHDTPPGPGPAFAARKVIAKEVGAALLATGGRVMEEDTVLSEQEVGTFPFP